MTPGSRRTIGLVVAAVALLAGGVVWISASALRLARQEAAARERAALEEAVRLALWRMDSFVAPILAREQALVGMTFAGAARTFVVAEAVVGPSGPAVPPGTAPALARRLARVDGASLSAALAREAGQETLGMLGVDQPRSTEEQQPGKEQQQQPGKGQPQPGQPGKGQPQPQGSLAYQSYRNNLEWSARSKSVRAQAQIQESSIANSLARSIPGSLSSSTERVVERSAAGSGVGAGTRSRSRSPAEGKELPPVRPGAGIAAPAPPPTPAGLLHPVWAAGELVLAQRRGGGYRVVLLDWPTLAASLVGEVADLLPAAALVPTPAGAAGEGAGITPDAPERLLASLPLKLVPGALPAEVQSGGGAPVMLGLGVAWASVLLAIAAVAGLLVGAVALSERRAVFVSAVTHELRTPLTTFRTYTEMLSRGMVPEGSRGQYLDTLFREAERLCHLTENVLLYSRLERGGGGHRVEEVDLHDLVARVEARLGARLREAGMTIDGAPPGSPTAPVRARGDATAIEQILFNVVDNACKYAAAADDRQIRIRIRAGSGGGTAVVEMSDGGPGIPAADRRRLFRPFSRSARDAAGRAPGVGLGLALSRRLARGMGGDLQLADSPTGARFVLTLPAV